MRPKVNARGGGGGLNTLVRGLKVNVKTMFGRGNFEGTFKVFEIGELVPKGSRSQRKF